MYGGHYLLFFFFFSALIFTDSALHSRWVQTLTVNYTRCGSYCLTPHPWAVIEAYLNLGPGELE